jgi:hypothetical protein
MNGRTNGQTDITNLTVALRNFTNADKKINSVIAKLNLICHLLELLGARHILHVSRIRVKYLTWYESPCCVLYAELSIKIHQTQYFIIQNSTQPHVSIPTKPYCHSGVEVGGGGFDVKFDKRLDFKSQR